MNSVPPYEHMTREELLDALRVRADGVSESASLPAAPRSLLEEKDALLHDLQVHQIELEMQNRELRESRAALEESRARYADLYDFAPVGYCTLDARGRIFELNLAAAALLGHDRAALTGRLLGQVTPGAEASRAVRAHVAACAAGDARVETEVAVTVRGRRAVLQVLSVPYETRGATLYRTSLTDVTALKRAQEVLGWIGSANAGLSDSLDEDAIVAAVLRLCVPFLADACSVHLADDGGAVRRVEHYERGERGERGDRAPAREQHAGVAAAVARALETGHSQLLANAVHSDPQRSSPVDPGPPEAPAALGVRSAAIAPIASRGRVVGALALVGAPSRPGYGPVELRLAEDLAERAGLALEHARLYREAREARASAEAATRSKDDFLASVSHELRTPLTCVLGWTSLLRAGTVEPEDVSMAIETVDRNARSLAQLVSDLLDTARIVAGKVHVEKMPMDLAAEVASAVDSLQLTAGAKGVRLTASADPPVCAIQGDPDRLRQVVLNLLTNAIKFTPAGGAVRATVRFDGASAEVCVTDTGVGIAPALLPHVFERFRQGEDGCARLHGGLGLGLAIVRHLVERHGGTVRADSEGPGRGSSFRVRVPRKEEPGEPDLQRDAPTRASSALHAGLIARDALHGLRVLVVDDDPDARTLFVSVLGASGAQVTAAGSRSEALSAFASSSPQVLVLDLGIGDEDGCALLGHLRRTFADAVSVPALALTAYAGGEDRARTHEAGFAAHIEKPVTPAQLVAAVSTIASAYLSN